jgi:hypothetical protein
MGIVTVNKVISDHNRAKTLTIQNSTLGSTLFLKLKYQGDVILAHFDKDQATIIRDTINEILREETNPVPVSHTNIDNFIDDVESTMREHTSCQEDCAMKGEITDLLRYLKNGAYNRSYPASDHATEASKDGVRVGDVKIVF